MTAVALITSNYAIYYMLNSQWPWMFEVFSDANPYILLITSGMLRKRIRKMFINISVNTTTKVTTKIAERVSNNQNMVSIA
jgi:hypothetical protein